MLKIIHQLRVPHVRLLASMLVMVAILCNNFGLVQAHAMSAKADCCPEMSSDQMAYDEMGSNVDTCPESNSDCNDQCMARCMSANGMLAVAFTISPGVLITSQLSRFNTTEHSLADVGPGLRPPIYS
jgi:hypothetical protein